MLVISNDIFPGSGQFSVRLPQMPVIQLPTMAAQPHEWTQIGFNQHLDVGYLHAFHIRHAYPRHSHDYYVICVVERGVQSFMFEGQRRLTPPGGMIFLNPGDVHTGEPADAKGFEYRALYPAVAQMQMVAREIGLAGLDLPYFSTPRADDPHLAAQVRGLHQVLQSQASALEQDSKFLLAMAGLLNQYASAQPIHNRLGRERRAVAAACEFIDAHFAQGLSLRQLATQVGLSPYYLLRVFRAEVGMPPHAYLESVRIREAQLRLAAGLPIAQVALETGFSSQSHFTNRFKQFIGVPPGQYIQQGSRV